MKYPLAPRSVAPPQIRSAPVATIVVTSPPQPEEVTDAMVIAARSLRPTPAIRLVSAHYSRICRLAISLCGEEKLGRAAVRKVLRKSIRFMPTWQDAQAASNWFLHYTILVSREKAGITLDPAHDCLTQRMDRPPTQYVAFVRAVRLLEPSHREALLLALGEKLELRQAAIAMDSSTTAVAAHMESANKFLTPIAGQDFDILFTALARVYASLTPPQQTIQADMDWLGRKLRFRQIVRLIRLIIMLALLATIAWAAWVLSHRIVV
jgi:DNA-directed RNA polymerase specialized sigma24 family protein